MPSIQEPKQINVIEFDERFYQVGPDTFYTSVTYILGCCYPSGAGLTQWIGDVGNKRAEEIRDEAGEDGSFVHDAIDRMLHGQKITSQEIEEKFKKSARILKIKKCLKSFIDWYNEYKPEIIKTEFMIVNSEYQFGGTVDLLCKINGENYIIDYKTSKSISEEHRVQLSAYNKEVSNLEYKMAILHLGNTTIKGYSFLEVKDNEKYFKQFQSVNNLFKQLNPNARPQQNVFPLEFFVNI